MPALPLPLSLLQLGGHVLLAWLTACACVFSAARHARKVGKLGPPAVDVLLAELLDESPPPSPGPRNGIQEPSRRAAIAELNQRLSDVSFQLTLLPARLAALTRISLASGTGLALLGYIGSSSSTALERVLGFVICMLGGLVGALGVLAIGRTAKERSAHIRSAWDRASRETGKALGTSLRG